jgi:signal transduction histidine kinase
MQAGRSDDSGRGVLTQFSKLARAILRYSRADVSFFQLLREASVTLLETSGADAVEWWLNQGGGYFHYEVVEDPGHLRSQVSYLDVLDPEQEIIAGTQDRQAVLELFSAARKSCQGADTATTSSEYPSVMLVRLPAGGEIAGFLQLKSRQAGKLSSEDAEFYDAAAEALGVALAGHSANAKLHERIKELSCLYAVLQLAENPGASLEEVLRGIVELIPPAWQFPSIAAARIELNDNTYCTAGFRETPWRQSADFAVGTKHKGRVEVVYLEERPRLHEGPFLAEERHLVDALAQEISGIIARRQTREDMAHLEDQLRHADRLATLGQLAAGVAHELNEPLSAILGFAQLALKTKGLPETVGRDLLKVVDASLYSRKIVSKLRLFSRQMPPELTEVSLNRVIADGLTFLRSRCTTQGITIVEDLDPELPEIVADQGQLHQVLVNLVVNATQAMPNGGTLTIRTRSAGEEVSLLVEDTGTGMSEQIIEKIFLPFFTTRSTDQGTGLGLSVVHGIVTAHAGMIEVQSKPGRGSRFEVRLPVGGVPHPVSGVRS